MVCAVRQNGEVPPGNAKGNTTWATRRGAARPEIKLTPGKGLQDLSCSVEDLIDQVVKSNKVSHTLHHPDHAICAIVLHEVALRNAVRAILFLVLALPTEPKAVLSAACRWWLL